MITETVHIFGIAQIFIQLFAAYFSYRIYTYNRLTKAWLLVTIALVLMAIRRITALLIGFGYVSPLTGPAQSLDRVWLPFFTSVFLLVGLWSMLKRFRSFEIAEKGMEEKIKKFSAALAKSVKQSKKGGKKK